MYVFLLGRPGSGKSEIYRRLTDKLISKNIYKKFQRVDDFPKLWRIFQEDEKTGKWRYCKKTPDGGYKIIDDSIWDKILVEVNRDIIQQKEPDKIIFVEFSRPNYVHSLKNFSEEVLRDSIIVYIDCSFETCWKRNVRRHEQALKEGTDDHLVSREEMEKTYLYDDRDELIEYCKNRNIPVVVVNTDYEKTTEHLEKAGEILSEEIKKFKEK
ncbi:MAG: hypothetical protein ACK4JE_04470 [Endomicrobiia bacterium]